MWIARLIGDDSEIASGTHDYVDRKARLYAEQNGISDKDVEIVWVDSLAKSQTISMSKVTEEIFYHGI